MLRGWGMSIPWIPGVWHKCTIPHRPHIRPIGDLQELVHYDSPSLLGARERRDERTGHSAGGPYQSAARNWNPVGQKDLVLCHALDPGIKQYSDSAPGEHFLRVSAQVFTQFGQDNRARMH